MAGLKVFWEKIWNGAIKVKNGHFKMHLRGRLEKSDAFFQPTKFKAGNTKGGSITVLLTSCLTGLD